MMHRVSRRGFLSATAALASVSLAMPLPADAPSRSLRPVARADDLLKRIQPSAEALIARSRLGGRVGCVVLDAATSDVLEAQNATLRMPPASVAKALTAAYALDALGADHRFKTRLIATGPLNDGALDGDLVLVGGGDPTLDSDGLAALAAQLKETGLREIRGGFHVWGGALPRVARIDPDQPDHVGYNPTVSGLNLNFNRVHFEWRRAADAYAVTMDARSGDLRPAVELARMSVAPRAAPVYTYADRDGRDEWTVARDALGNGGARWLPMRKPDLYAGEVFQTLARAHGIVLPAATRAKSAPQGTTLAQVESGPLDEMLRGMLKWSTNLTAEVVGLAASAARMGRAPESLERSAAEMSRWVETTLGAGALALVDHSGLNDRSRISAAVMARALQSLRRSSALKSLLKTVPMRDETRNILPDHPLAVRAKTGTLNFVSGLAGFVDLPDGGELIFAIFCADLERRDTLTIEQRERPPGGIAWNRRAKALQQALIQRWGVMYTG